MFVVTDIQIDVKIFHLQQVGTVMLCRHTQWRWPTSSWHCRSRAIDAILYSAQEAFILKKLHVAIGYGR